MFHVKEIITQPLYSDNNNMNICKEALKEMIVTNNNINQNYITNRITPRLHKSHLLSYVVACVLKASTTSGAMYSAEPTCRKQQSYVVSYSSNKKTKQ